MSRFLGLSRACLSLAFLGSSAFALADTAAETRNRNIGAARYVLENVSRFNYLYGLKHGPCLREGLGEGHCDTGAVHGTIAMFVAESSVIPQAGPGVGKLQISGALPRLAPREALRRVGDTNRFDKAALKDAEQEVVELISEVVEPFDDIGKSGGQEAKDVACGAALAAVQGAMLFESGLSNICEKGICQHETIDAQESILSKAITAFPSGEDSLRGFRSRVQRLLENLSSAPLVIIKNELFVKEAETKVLATKVVQKLRAEIADFCR